MENSVLISVRKFIILFHAAADLEKCHLSRPLSLRASTMKLPSGRWNTSFWDALGSQCLRSLQALELSVNSMGLCLSFGHCSHALISLSTSRSVTEQGACETVQAALRRGINYIDTAYYYGQGTSEKLLGLALKSVPRKAYYIATKIGRYELDYAQQFDFSAAMTRKSVERSLKFLQLDYIDVIQIHDVEFAPNLEIVLKVSALRD